MYIYLGLYIYGNIKVNMFGYIEIDKLINII